MTVSSVVAGDPVVELVGEVVLYYSFVVCFTAFFMRINGHRLRVPLRVTGRVIFRIYSLRAMIESALYCFYEIFRRVFHKLSFGVAVGDAAGSSHGPFRFACLILACY